jgi:hypothetical protein
VGAAPRCSLHRTWWWRVHGGVRRAEGATAGHWRLGCLAGRFALPHHLSAGPTPQPHAHTAEMRRHHSSSSPLGSAQGAGSPQPTVATSSAPASAEPSALPAEAALQSTLASLVGTHRSFEAATQATSRAFQEALRDSFSAERDGQEAAPPPPEPR